MGAVWPVFIPFAPKAAYCPRLNSSLDHYAHLAILVADLISSDLTHSPLHPIVEPLLQTSQRGGDREAQHPHAVRRAF